MVTIINFVAFFHQDSKEILPQSGNIWCHFDTTPNWGYLCQLCQLIFGASVRKPTWIRSWQKTWCYSRPVGNRLVASLQKMLPTGCQLVASFWKICGHMSKKVPTTSRLLWPDRSRIHPSQSQSHYVITKFETKKKKNYKFETVARPPITKFLNQKNGSKIMSHPGDGWQESVRVGKTELGRWIIMRQSRGLMLIWWDTVGVSYLSW
jgi:hypothetical protein